MMERVEEHKSSSNSTIIRRKEMHFRQKTSIRYAKMSNNASLGKNSTEEEKSEEEKLEERGIRIVESNIRNYSNISPIEVTDYYRGLGVWQEVLPKTDYSYSPVSIYNRRKINGIYPVVPNMSRQSLWKNNLENTEISDNHMNSFYAKQYSILNSKRWLTREKNVENVDQHLPSSYSNTLNLRQWISSKCSFVWRSVITSNSRWQSLVKKIRTHFLWTKSAFSESSSSWLKSSAQYVFSFLILSLIVYFLLWFPVPVLSPLPVDFISKRCNEVFVNVSYKIQSLFNLVYTLIDFTLNSGAFLLSSISSPHNLTFTMIPSFMFTSFFEESRAHRSEKADRTIEKESLSWDKMQVEELFHRLFDSSSSKMVRKILDSREFVEFMNEKFENVEKEHERKTEQMMHGYSHFEKRLKGLELLLLETNFSEQIKELRMQVLELREEIESKKTKIESDFFLLMSTILQVDSSEQTSDTLKAKFRSLFRSIESAHFKIDSLDREFSNYVNNASKLKNNEQQSNDELKFNLKSFVEELTTKKLKEWEVASASSKKSFASTDVKINQINDIEENVRKIVREALEIYDADKTGMTDYALESSGGIILSTRCTETKKSNAQFSILGIPFWQTSRSPRTVIQPSIHPGECWAFPGSTGYLVIQLSNDIFITGVSLEHIPKAIAINGTIDSAPKDFSVWALRTETDEEPKFLGKFQYNDDGPSLQYFEVVPLDQAYRIVELKILSNHGKIDYTCLYRFRVHGIPT